MKKGVIFLPERTPALSCAAKWLEKNGVEICSTYEAGVTHILFGVPTKEADGAGIPENVTVIGGNLTWLPESVPRLDLLKEDRYVAENAALTADCALRVLGQHLKTAIRGCEILIIGWGRIGKCLASMLKALGAQVTVAARKPSDLGMLTALGYGAISAESIDPRPFRVIFNTAPAPVLGPGEGIRIDLASRQGIAGENVIWARGLPGKMLPESSGKLIAEAILRNLEEGEK